MRDAEVLFEVVAQFFCQHGLPGMLTFDNDPRLVGSPAGRDFPSALVRFLLCLGVIPHVIPPHRPDKNAGRSSDFTAHAGQECLHVHRPGTLSEVSERAFAFLTHYNDQRPSPRALLWEPTAAGGLSSVSDAACCSPDRRS